MMQISHVDTSQSIKYNYRLRRIRDILSKKLMQVNDDCSERSSFGYDINEVAITEVTR